MQSSLDNEEMEDYDSYDAQSFVFVDKETDAVRFVKTPSPKITSPVSPKSPSQSSIKPFPKADSTLLVELKFDDDDAKKCEFQCTANLENVIEAKSNDEAWLIDFDCNACVENENIETKECIQTLETVTEAESDVSDGTKVESFREDNKMPSQVSTSMAEKGEYNIGKEENEEESQNNIMGQMFTKVEDDTKENSETENYKDKDEQASTGSKMVNEKHDEIVQDFEIESSEEETNVYFKLAQTLAKIEKNDRDDVKLDDENIEEDRDYSQVIDGKGDDGAKNNEVDKNFDILVDHRNAGKEKFGETDFDRMENETSSQSLQEKGNDKSMINEVSDDNINKDVTVHQIVFEVRGNVTDSFETEQDEEETEIISQMAQETTNGKEENICGSEANDLEINISVLVGEHVAPMEAHVMNSAKIENKMVAQMREDQDKEYVWNNNESEMKERIMVAGSIDDMNAGTSDSINAELETEENELCEQIAKEKNDFKEENINRNEFLRGEMKEGIIVTEHDSEMKDDATDSIKCKLETEETEIGKQNARGKNDFKEENDVGNGFQRGKMKECIMVAGNVDEMNDGSKDSMKSELETEKTGAGAQYAAQRNREYSLLEDSIEIEINQKPIDEGILVLNESLVKKEIIDHAADLEDEGDRNDPVDSIIESEITEEVINESTIILQKTDLMMDINDENESNEGIINDNIDVLKKSCDETGNDIINENGNIQVDVQIHDTGDSMEFKFMEGNSKSLKELDDCGIETKGIQYPICEKEDSVTNDLVSDDLMCDVSDSEKIDEEENWVESFLEQEGRSSTYGSNVEIDDASEKECLMVELSGSGNSIDLKVESTLKQTGDNEKKPFDSNDKPKQAHLGSKKIVAVDQKEKTARNFAKEEMLNKRIFEIRKKNEERLRRAEEIEADKRQAEILERKGKLSSADHHIVAFSRVTNVRARGRGRGRGRGISLVNNYTDSPRRTFIGRGRGSMRSDDLKEKIRDKSDLKDTKVEDEVRKDKELASRSSRDDRKASQLHEHWMPRNDYLSIREKREGQKQMTNKEKEHYSAYNAWKNEREAIEEARIKRHKEADGKWVREWDQEKIWDERSRQWVPHEQKSIARARNWGFRGKEKNRGGDSFTAKTEEEW